MTRVLASKTSPSFNLHIGVLFISVLFSLPLLVNPGGQFVGINLLNFVQLAIDVPHLGSTGFGVSYGLRERIISKRTLILILILVPVSVFTIYYVDKQIFALVLGIVAVFHVCRQQYGWLRLSNFQPGMIPNSKVFDQSLVWGIMAYPILFWLGPESSLSRSYFYVGNLDILSTLISPLMIDIFKYLHYGVLILYVGYLSHGLSQGKRINEVKLAVVAITWLMFAGALVWLGSYVVFVQFIAINHGLSYLFFVENRLQFSTKGSKSSYAAAVLGYGSLLYFANEYLGMPIYSKSTSIVEPIMWSPLIFHYAFDAFIWRKKIPNS